MNQPNSVAQASVQAAQAAQGTPGIPVGMSLNEMFAMMQTVIEENAKLKAQVNQQNPAGEMAELAAMGMREYYHRTPGSSIVIVRKGPSGENIPETWYFDARGCIATDDVAVHAFMKGVVNKPGSPIFTNEMEARMPDPEVKAAAQQVIDSAAKTIDKLAGEARR